jgi:uncharacterized protein (TIRG00374 family)
MAIDNKNHILKIVKLVLGITLLLLLLTWNNNGRNLLKVFSELKPVYFVLLILLSIILNLVSSVKWSLFLHDKGIDITQFKLFKLYLIGKFFSNFLPTMVGGDITRAYLLGKEINSHSQSMASVFLERITGLYGLAIIAIIFSLINYKILFNPVISISISSVAAGCLLGLILFFKSSVKNLILQIIPDFSALKKFKIKFEKLSDDIGYYKSRRMLLLSSLGLSVCFHLIACVNVYIACVSIGFYPDFIDVLVITPVILILTMIPVSPGNIGWWEWCFSVLLIDAGASSSEGLAVALMLRAITLLASLIGGLFFLQAKRTPKVT